MKITLTLTPRNPPAPVIRMTFFPMLSTFAAAVAYNARLYYDQAGWIYIVGVRLRADTVYPGIACCCTLIWVPWTRTRGIQ